MAEASFEAALEQVLREEGGYVDHPADPGGATMRGITQATLAAWRGRAVTKAEVKALSRDDVSSIYRTRYWDAVKGDALPAGIDLALFDLAVNSGPSRAVKLMQRALGLTQDGALGAETLAAIRAGEPRAVIAALMIERKRFLGRLATWPIFGRGWSRRLQRIETAAIRLAVPAGARPAKKETTMDETKPFYLSKTVWANLIGLAALALSLFGFNTSLLDPQAVAEAILQAVAALSFVLSTAFRVLATKRVG